MATNAVFSSNVWQPLLLALGLAPPSLACGGLTADADGGAPKDGAHGADTDSRAATDSGADTDDHPPPNDSGHGDEHSDTAP